MMVMLTEFMEMGFATSIVTGSQTIQNDIVSLLRGRGFEGCMRDVRIYNRALSLT